MYRCNTTQHCSRHPARTGPVAAPTSRPRACPRAMPRAPVPDQGHPRSRPRVRTVQLASTLPDQTMRSASSLTSQCNQYLSLRCPPAAGETSVSCPAALAGSSSNSSILQSQARELRLHPPRWCSPPFLCLRLYLAGGPHHTRAPPLRWSCGTLLHGAHAPPPILCGPPGWARPRCVGRDGRRCACDETTRRGGPSTLSRSQRRRTSRRRRSSSTCSRPPFGRRPCAASGA